MREPRKKTIAITSGKGGVGKSSIVANMAYLLARRKMRTYVFDANLSLGDIDLMMGLAPPFNIGDLIDGTRNISDIVVETDSGVKLIPASSGNPQLSHLSIEEEMIIQGALHDLPDFDFLLIDTASGISSNVIYFAAATDEVWMVVTPDPTSIRDAYVTIKVLHRVTARKDLKIFVNKASDEREALDVYRTMHLVTDWSYDVFLHFAGYIPIDLHFDLALRKHQLCAQLFPEALASKAIIQMCDKLLVEQSAGLRTGVIEAVARPP